VTSLLFSRDTQQVIAWYQRGKNSAELSVFKKPGKILHPAQFSLDTLEKSDNVNWVVHKLVEIAVES
jgi:hypothetical protein